jgi:arsenate reductase
MRAAMPLTIYHNPRCTKSRETLALLEARGLSPAIIEYLKTPPSAAELTRIVKLLGVPASAILRKAEAKEASLDPATLSETDLIAAMVKNPVVIERPIVINGDKAAVGRPPENVLKIL